MLGAPGHGDPSLQAQPWLPHAAVSVAISVSLLEGTPVIGSEPIVIQPGLAFTGRHLQRLSRRSLSQLPGVNVDIPSGGTQPITEVDREKGLGSGAGLGPGDVMLGDLGQGEGGAKGAPRGWPGRAE